ncbi:MAG TPA: hypothetical protein VNR87_03230, partial [Flavisolibacter sp.]|nr:hypothetical protein [Flavisolibacter sp.]
MSRILNNFKNTFLLVLFFAVDAAGVRAQELDKDVVARLVAIKEFTFKATSMLPAGAGVRQLTSEYDV